MDISKIVLPENLPTKDIKASELAPLDVAKLRVASRLLKKSIGAVVQTAIYTYVRKCWADHEDLLIAEANQQGITPEEMFSRLLEESLTEGSKRNKRIHPD